MRILFFIPDNRITRNHMPVLWPWLLRAYTPPEHQVTIIDGNSSRVSAENIAELASEKKIDLVGIGAMTRTVQTAYDAADQVRKKGIPVVFGGPHVSSYSNSNADDSREITGEAAQHCDSMVIGEADDLWPAILQDVQNGRLQPLYRAIQKPNLQNYPRIPWEEANLKQFTVIPQAIRQMIRASGYREFDFNMTPMETGRGCPYGCDFCSVTNFFGDKVRVRTIDSVIEEMILLKELKRRFLFFVDDNFGIYDKFGRQGEEFRDRTRRLLQAMIDRKIRIPWACQISTNLADPETKEGRELVDLMRGAMCVGVYMGLESVAPGSLKEVSKSFNKPAHYGRILDYLDRSGIYTLTGFIYGMDSDQPGVAQKTWEEVRRYPPSIIPIFSPLTPLPGTQQYARLRQEKRLVEGHWRNYRAYVPPFEPKQMSAEQLQSEVRQAWLLAYDPAAILQRLRLMRNRPFFERLLVFAANLMLRGVYFPQMNFRSWMRLFWENRRSFGELFFRSRRLVLRTHVQPLHHPDPHPPGAVAPTVFPLPTDG